jgi:hypothetical protein
MKRLPTVLAVALALALAGCSDRSASVTEIQAMDIAGLFVEKYCPEMLREPTRPMADLHQTRWLVTYQRPDGSRVGSAAVQIDHLSGRVLGVTGGQCAGMKAADPPAKLPEGQAIKIANEYVAANYGPSLSTTTGATAHDQGPTWIVTYQVPDGSIGGTPTLEIDKRTRRILHARHTQ